MISTKPTIVLSVVVLMICIYACDPVSITSIRNDSSNPVGVTITYDKAVVSTTTGDFYKYLESTVDETKPIEMKVIDSAEYIVEYTIGGAHELQIDFDLSYYPDFDVFKSITVMSSDTFTIFQRDMPAYFKKNSKVEFTLAVD